MISVTSNPRSFAVLLFVLSIVPEADAQFEFTWLDIGEMHGRYSDIGAASEGLTSNRGLEWPAILRQSGHYRAKGYWIGLKNWTDETGEEWDYHVAMAGPLRNGELYFTPIENRLVGRFEDTEIFVDGYPAEKNLGGIDEVDPELPADRMLYQRYRSILGIETERWIYAYANETHDDYHIIRRRMTNNGNTDRDSNIDLDGQSLNDVLFFNMYRWVGREQAATHGPFGQLWGRYSMVDIVGDGHQEYPVDFTAVYLWAGFDPAFSGTFGWNELGSPMLRVLDQDAPGDTIGRLAGMSMPGRVVLHADESTTDTTYDPLSQPSTLGWVSANDIIDGHSTIMDYYELYIRSRENPDFVQGGFSRMYPHYADRVEPGGEFWKPVNDASSGHYAGWSPIISYGPYQMAFGESIDIVEAEGAAGLSYEAATQIGVAYKANGFDDDARIAYDANGDGVINDAPWNYDVYKNGSELITKNQWVMTARDSLFQLMYRARDVWEASNGMTEYPIIEPPRPPKRFEVFGRPDKVELRWESMAGVPDPVQWDIYRTTDYADNLPYEFIASLPGSARSFDDVNLLRGVEYYYFIQAVGDPNPVDEKGISGTPGGLPLKSGRYFTQTFLPTRLSRLPGVQIGDFRIVPNPINLATDESIRLFIDNDPTRGGVEFFDIPGNCTITIYTETGEFVKRINHTNGSGYNAWDLTTDSRLPVVSGLYLVRVEDRETGAIDVKKLVVIK